MLKSSYKYLLDKPSAKMKDLLPSCIEEYTVDDGIIFFFETAGYVIAD